VTGHPTEEALDLAIEEAVETDQLLRSLLRRPWREELDEADDYYAREDKVYDRERGDCAGW
jgi:hypothetical protein